MKKEKKMLDVIFILDKSGSMSGSEESTISSFNEYLEKEKKHTFQTNITTILFSDQYQYLHHRSPIQQVHKLTKKDYSVGGCTALYDALGNGISFMEQEHAQKVLFIIITDGYENASSEYSKSRIKNLIKKHDNWEFIYIGADIDSYSAGHEIGIRENNIANYKKDAKGTSKMFQAVCQYECAMMDNRIDEAAWKSELEA